MLEVIKKGLETSVQDWPGRHGYWNQGFPLRGRWTAGRLDWRMFWSATLPAQRG